jgi:hypothetical protein
MSTEIKKEIQPEIAHVLFIDIVGYSKLSINEQHMAVDQLTKIVRATQQFQKARRIGIGVLHKLGSAGSLRGRAESRAQRSSALTPAHGHSQRTGEGSN